MTVLRYLLNVTDLLYNKGVTGRVIGEVIFNFEVEYLVRVASYRKTPGSEEIKLEHGLSNDTTPRSLRSSSEAVEVGKNFERQKSIFDRLSIRSVIRSGSETICTNLQTHPELHAKNQLDRIKPWGESRGGYENLSC